jgi:hypothetical protein
MKPLNRTTIKVDSLPPNGTEYVKIKLNVVTSGVQYYFNSQHLLYRLGKDARAFYDFLCEAMNDQNNIMVNAPLKTAFTVHFRRLTSKPKLIAESSLSTYLSKMVDLGLLISNGGTRNGFYCVNPKYAFKGTNHERIKLITKLIQT